MKQGEIWTVQFPEGVGHEYMKDRPALIIESDEQLQKTNILTIIPITSNINNCMDDDVLITRDKYNNLYADSVLKVHHIQTFDKSRFVKKWGKVKDDILTEVKGYLKIHFNL